MEFCPHCGSAVLPQKKNGKVRLTCTGCGYVNDMPRRVVKTFGKAEKRVFVVEDPEQERLASWK